MKILYVEDHAVFAEAVRERFLCGHTVQVVSGVAAAWEALGEAEFDVLLVDYDLEDGKGATLVQRMRGCGIPTPVIAVSSHETGNQALAEAGADRVCAKAEVERLPEVLAELLGGEAPGSS